MVIFVFCRVFFEYAEQPACVDVHGLAHVADGESKCVQRLRPPSCMACGVAICSGFSFGARPAPPVPPAAGCVAPHQLFHPVCKCMCTVYVMYMLCVLPEKVTLNGGKDI